MPILLYDLLHRRLVLLYRDRGTCLEGCAEPGALHKLDLLSWRELLLDNGAAVMRTRKTDEGSPAHLEVQSVEWGSLGSKNLQ